MSSVTLGELLTSKYASWIDSRSSDDGKLHGSGRRLENINDGITLQITKSADSAGAIIEHVYLIMDAQLNIIGGRYNQIIF